MHAADHRSGGGPVTGRLRLVAMLASGLIASSLATGTALAQEPNQVTGVAVEQADGFAALSWDPVAGATDYQIERTPVGSDDVPTGPGGDRGPVAAEPHGHAQLPGLRGRRIQSR